MGTYGQFQELGNRTARLILFENIGTATKPAFELVDDDYLGMRVFGQNTYNFTPTLGDLDGDGDLDILVGEEQGRLFYAENIAGAGEPVAFGAWQYGFADINVGVASTPQIIDLNRDGLPDLVIGERNGNLNYFQNIGTADAPQFVADPAAAPNTDRLGSVDARTPGLLAGYSAPLIVDAGTDVALLLGTNVGQIKKYTALKANIYGTFVNETQAYGNIREGAEARLAAHDLDGDGFLEMVVGNLRGGLSMFKTDMPAPVVSSTDAPQPPASIRIFPNPATDAFTIATDAGSAAKNLQLFNAAGQLALQRTWRGSQMELDVRHLPGGVYFAQVEWDGTFVKKKVVILK